MTDRDPIGEAGLIQRQAADPAVSAAVRASAGSGKTKVLVDRFLRLCVEGEHNEVHPRSILAVTFTRKAATEILERLARRARELALAQDDRQREMLSELFGRDPLPEESRRAARLYENLLAHVGGLQVGTIHSFCQRILGRFAAEAGMDPRAQLIEDADELLDEALDRMITLIATDPERTALASLISSNPIGQRKKLREFYHQRLRLERWLRRLATTAGRPLEPRVDLLPEVLTEWRAFLFPGDDPTVPPTPELLLAELKTAVARFAGEGLDRVERRFEGEDAKRLAKSLSKLRQTSAAALELDEQAGLDAAREILLTKAGKLRAVTLIKDEDLKATFTGLVLEEGAELLALYRKIDLVALYETNAAVGRLGLELLDIYSDLKRRDGVIDFGDLEEMACRLMGDEARALSLLYRLDDSITHILLDEFQDTNWNQLEILEPFISEFLSGGTGEHRPTVFVVGDLKQSIYGFRGAEPQIFEGLSAMLAARGWPTPTLPTNFRSLAAVVDGVGSLFTQDPLASRLPADESTHVHQAFARTEDTGKMVVLESFIVDPSSDEIEDERSGSQVAADAAARLIREMVDRQDSVWEGWGSKLNSRPVEYGDILVLMRNRNQASFYEQAFRAAGIPIEPAGRGMLAACREVQDILALLRWLVWSDDDVALATVLRSPLFRVSEERFQQLLGARGLLETREDGRYRTPKGLWRALRDAGKNDAQWEAVTQRLTGWRRATGLGNCHDLLRRIYREGQVADRYEAAAGLQARINLERLFDLSLGHGAASTPTVRRFIEVLDRAGKRGGEDEGAASRSEETGRVRLMTIHGSKGLEAPVVLLVDADRAISDRDSIVRMDATDRSPGLLFGAVRALRDGITGAEDFLEADSLQECARAALRSSEIEETNLLYVAVTRARDRLVVLGGAKPSNNPPETPLRQLEQSAEAAGPGSVLREDPPGWERPPLPVVLSERVDKAETVRHRLWTPPVMSPRIRIETPSSKDAPPLPRPVASGQDEIQEAATVHGNRVHLWLQTACSLGTMPPGQGRAHEEAAGVFDDPELAWIFRPESGGRRGWSEAPVIHRITNSGKGTETRMTGIIDRLVIGPEKVDIVDYKTNRWGGDPAHAEALIAHYQPQLASYREAIEAIYPDREVRTWLLLTDPAGRSQPDRGLKKVL